MKPDPKKPYYIKYRTAAAQPRKQARFKTQAEQLSYAKSIYESDGEILGFGRVGK